MDQGSAWLTRGVISVDVVCFTVRDGELELGLVQRAQPPFEGMWALPGGMIGAEETAAVAARRILRLRMGIDVAYLEQLFTFTAPQRDPRGRTISIAHYALIPVEATEASLAGEGAAALRWQAFAELPALAFDHAAIARYARERLRQKARYTPILFRLLPPQFTMSELRSVSRAVEARGDDGHLSNFAALMRARWPLEPVAEPPVASSRRGRPARRFRFVGSPDIPGPPEGEAV